MRLFAKLVLIAVSGLVVKSHALPRCDVRAGEEGAPAILVDGSPHVPIFFSGNNQFNRDEVLLEELTLARDAGVKLFSFNVPSGWYATEEQAAAIVDKFCSVHPTGYFYVRIWLGANQGWLKQHPDEQIRQADGSAIAYASPASEVWREAAADALAQRLEEIADGPHGDRFIGVCPVYLQTGEWFYAETETFQDYSRPSLEAFRDWLKKKYKSDSRLQEAWGNSDATLKTAEFPDPVARDAAVWGSFRDPVAHRPAMDMERFQSELVVDTIRYFAKVAKKATRNNSLVGVFYGYTMELNNNGPRSLAHSGHLAFGQLLNVPEIDMIHAPYSYFERAPGQPGHMHLPLDSAPLHNKLVVLEEDSYTHLGQAKPTEKLIAPGWNARTANMDETLAVNLRNAGNFLSHRAGMWYFDLLSDGRWNAPVVWDTSVLLRRVAAELRSEPFFSPEIAFVIDEEAVQYMRDNSHPYLIHALSWWRAELDRIGAPVGYFLMSDLAALPASVKVIILPNAFSLSYDVREYLAQFMDAGGSVVWTYAPGIMGAGGPDPARIRELTGVSVEAAFDSVPMVIVSDISEETAHIDEASWRPRFIVNGGQGKTLSHYQETSEISAVALDMGDGKSVYTATPRLPVGVLRWIAEDAGVHIYRETPGMAARAGNYLFVHTEDAVIETFHWPAPVQKITQVYPPAGDLTVEDGRSWSAVLTAKSTVVFHIEPNPVKAAGAAGNFN